MSICVRNFGPLDKTPVNINAGLQVWRVPRPRIRCFRTDPNRALPWQSSYLTGTTPDTSVFMRRFVLDARDYGVPQRRKRAFILGIRQDVPVPPTWETITPHLPGCSLRASCAIIPMNCSRPSWGNQHPPEPAVSCRPSQSAGARGTGLPPRRHQFPQPATSNRRARAIWRITKNPFLQRGSICVAGPRLTGGSNGPALNLQRGWGRDSAVPVHWPAGGVGL